MIEAGLFTYLTGISALTDRVNRFIYPLKMPDTLPKEVAAGTRDAITYQRISGERTVSHDGDSRLPHPRIQIDIWSIDYKRARATAQVLIDNLSGYRGAMGDHEVQAVFIEGDLDDYEKETKLYRVTLDARVWHKD